MEMGSDSKMNIKENMDKFVDKETDLTLNYYDKNANTYNETTVGVEFTDRQHMLLKYLAPESHILDLGCGSGRDSKAFLEKGFKITAMDGSKEMCQIASKYLGQKVIHKRFNELNDENVYDAVWACASLLHVPSTELQDIMKRIDKALKLEGFLYVSFKYGDFEGKRNGRYFTDMTEAKLKSILEPFKGLEIIEVEITSDVREGREEEKWLNAIMKKV